MDSVGSTQEYEGNKLHKFCFCVQTESTFFFFYWDSMNCCRQDIFHLVPCRLNYLCICCVEIGSYLTLNMLAGSNVGLGSWCPMAWWILKPVAHCTTGNPHGLQCLCTSPEFWSTAGHGLLHKGLGSLPFQGKSTSLSFILHIKIV